MPYRKTIYDIAEEAGVSPATVSRAISGTGYISDETRKRVLEVAQGFTPRKRNESANARIPSHCIGLVAAHKSSYFFISDVYSAIMTGISDYVTPRGYTLLLDTRGSGPESVVNLYKQGKVDGLILLGMKNGKEGNELLTLLQNEAVPFVLIGDYMDEFSIPPYSKIDIDDFSAAKDATDYLINLGHKRIAFISNSMDFSSTYNRYLGYKYSLEESDLKCESRNVISLNDMSEDGYINMTRHMLSIPDRPTAIITVNHVICINVCQAISQCGLSIPDDVSLLSFDDTAFTKYYSPPITTIWQPSQEKGRLAAETLISSIEDSTMSPRVLTVQSIIIYRSSCSVAPDSK